jgi:Zn ribbon nucleic-acid-binding protein
MAVSIFDHRLYTLECPKCRVIEEVQIGTLQHRKQFGCAACGYVHDLTAEPHQTALKHEYDIAQKIDDAKRAEGETIERVT